VKLEKEAGIKSLGPYELEDMEEVLCVTEANSGWGTQAVLTP
jgi:hypothetical protein